MPESNVSGLPSDQDNNLSPGHMARFTHVCKFCVYANFTHVSKSVHVTATFTTFAYMQNFAYIYAKFALGLDQVQTSICVYAKFAYMQICPYDRKAKFAYIFFNLCHINSKKALIQTAIIPKMTE